MGHKNTSRKTRTSIATAIIAAAVSLTCFSAQALKSDDNTLVEGAKLCTRYLPRHERQYGIPEHLLAAIASTESGRFHRALGLNLPWPWTINVEGAGYFFDTKEEAIAAVRAFQARGIASIDVGCMQVNLMHHPHAFASLEEAFDPAYNVAYAAQFLKQNFTEEGGNWRKATGDYHSHTLEYGEQYARLVYGAWERIINKVADARAGKPILNAQAAKSSYTSAHVYHPVHMHDITIAHARETTRENGVLVVRPDYDSKAATVQEASLEDTGDFVSHPHHPPPAASPERSAVAPEGGPLNISVDAQVDKGAKIVKVHNDDTAANPAANAAAGKGQFEPASRVIHMDRNGVVTDAPSASASASASGSTADVEAAKSPFIFNN